MKEKSGDRAKWLEKNADQKIDGKPLAALKAAESVEALVAALEKRTARTLTPHIVSPGSMVLQPSDERRRSGSHYTPRALTKPIVEKALEPVLQRLGESPTPEQILSLKVCDPAMGSGAFLVEACRQLGEALVRAWTQHGSLPRIPDDETPELFAQRTVSQRCLYGVDKNPMAVDLAKLSLWLATLAKDHPFTFVDHALKHGDSLVGLTLNQIRRFHWKANPLTQLLIGADELSRRVNEALVHRRAILAAGDEGSDDLKRQKLNLANEGLQKVRLAGDLAIGAFFAANSEKEREAERVRRFAALGEYLRTNNFALRPKTDEATLREGPHPLRPFHWEIEFPEVFLRESEGFDTIIGNPPFMGGRNVTTNLGGLYAEWILAVTQGAGGGADLVAHFFRRAFLLIRDGGTLGLLATNSVSQGDTRSAGLRWILSHGGEIYSANKRYKWPGAVAVVVSVVHITKGKVTVPKQLNGKPVEKITAYLFHEGSSDDPKTLSTNSGRSFQGSILLGMGFT
ncbi:MAG TPA: DNA methyltransferase, partial [Pirellulales bacterium]